MDSILIARILPAMFTAEILKIGRCSAGANKKLITKALVKNFKIDSIELNLFLFGEGFMLEIIAVFLVVFGVLGMFIVYSGMSLIFTLIVVFLFALFSGVLRRNSQQ